MAEQPASERPTDVGEPTSPRWVKLFGLVTLLALLAFAVVHLAGGGFLHFGGGEPAQQGPHR